MEGADGAGHVGGAPPCRRDDFEGGIAAFLISGIHQHAEHARLVQHSRQSARNREMRFRIMLIIPPRFSRMSSQTRFPKVDHKAVYS